MCYGNVRSSYGVRFDKMPKLQNRHIDMIFGSRNLNIYSSLFSVLPHHQVNRQIQQNLDIAWKSARATLMTVILVETI